MNVYLIVVDNTDKIKFEKITVKKTDPEGFHTSDRYCIPFERINLWSYFPYHIYFLDKKIAERCFWTIKNKVIKDYQESLDFYRGKLKKFKRKKWRGKVE